MEPTAQTLAEEHELFRAKVKMLIQQLYQQQAKNTPDDSLTELALLDEWEYEGQEFNAITEQGLARIIDEQTDTLFTWDDVETESLLEIVRIIEEKEFIN